MDELREKIAKTIANGFRHEVGKVRCFEKIANQILVIIKEAGYVKLADSQEIAELKEQIEYMHDVWEILIEVTEAECQERVERIFEWSLEPCPHWHMYPDVGVIKRDCSLCWQALKEKEGVK